MDDSSSTATAVAAAIAAALDWSSSPDARNAAFSYLEAVKSGDVRVLANTSLQLVRKDWSSVIRLHGLKLLQHLVRFKWDEFNDPEKKNFARVTISLISEMVDPREEWALKSQTAALVAEVVRREGLTLWYELLPSLVSLSNNGPIEAELVAMILRWLPEDITVHNEDLESDRRRVLLRGLTESLSEIFPLLYALLEKHFGAALNEYSKQQLDIAKQHATTVTAVLNAVNAYAEWAPVPDFAKYRLIRGCGILLSSIEFRFQACEFFKLLSQRKRPIDDTTSETDSAIYSIFQILMNVSKDFLNKSISGSVGIDETEFEFVECICESMAALGSNIRCIAGDAPMTSLYLQQMLGYFQHFKLVLHFQSLLFWLALMREPVSKAKAGALVTGEYADKEKKGMPIIITDDIYSAILDVCLQRMLKKNMTPGAIPSSEEFELWSDDFDGKSDFSHYRSRLLELIKLVASQKPVVAALRVSQRVDMIVSRSLHASASIQNLTLIESGQLGLDAVVSAIFDGSAESFGYPSEIKFQLHTILEGVLKQLLSLEWTEPNLAEILGRYLGSLGPYLKHFPDIVYHVIKKLFDLLTSLPIALKEPDRHARLNICASFIRIAKAAEKSLLTHLQEIAKTMARLQGEGRLLRSEHNLLGEAVLVMASFAGIQQQQEVLVWLLEPLSKQWTQIDWQNAYLSEPLGLTRLVTDTQFMWSIFHTITFFEKALKRSGVRKTSTNMQGCSPSSDPSTHLHPMSSHLSWMLPPLLRLLRSVHSLWSQPTAQALSGELRAALSMGQFEQASLLGDMNKKKGLLAFADGSVNDMNKEGESKENDLRNWLKGIRDSSYNVLGLSMTIGDSFFQCLESSSTALALMENLQSMEFRHIRQLIHSVLIPLVKSCPSYLWDAWLENFLHPLFLYSQQALTCSWSSLLHDGRAKVPDTFGHLSGLELEVEVMEEKLLRDFTREICSLLSVLASPALNSGLPSLEQLGHGNRMDASSQDLAAFDSSSIISFLLSRNGSALPAMRISIDVLAWTDGDAVTRSTSFCVALIVLAVSTNSVQLREFVANDLFRAIIQSLALESNALTSPDLVSLCREIYVYLADLHPAPRQVLLSLPSITRDDLIAFEDALTKTSSPKEQKLLMKNLLQLSTGNKLKALAAQRSTTVITNVTARIRTSATVPGHNIEDDSVIGLAAIT